MPGLCHSLGQGPEPVRASVLDVRAQCLLWQPHPLPPAPQVPGGSFLGLLMIWGGVTAESERVRPGGKENDAANVPSENTRGVCVAFKKATEFPLLLCIYKKSTLQISFKNNLSHSSALCSPSAGLGADAYAWPMGPSPGQA